MEQPDYMDLSDEQLVKLALQQYAKRGEWRGVKWWLRETAGIGSQRSEKILLMAGQVTVDSDPAETVQHTGFGFRIGVWDLEVTHLRADLGTLIVASFLDLFTKEIVTRTILDFEGPNRERQLAEWTAEQYEGFDILVGQNSKAFDKNFVNGVLGRYEMRHLPPRHHIDTYEVARYGLKGLLSSYSLENLANYFRLSKQKDKPLKDDWRQANILDDEAVARIKIRCEEDVHLTAMVFNKLKPYWHKWRGI